MKFHTMEAADNMVHSRGGGEDGDIVVDIRRDVEDADVVDNDDNVVVVDHMDHYYYDDGH